MNLARVLRAGIAILFVIVLAIIVRHFAVRSISEFKIPSKTEKIDPNKIEKKEKVVHFEIKGDKKTVQVEADKHYMGEDGNYYAEGNVKMVFFKKREDKDVSLYGNKVVYDKDRTHVESYGKAKATFEDLVIESSLLRYDKKSEILSTDSGVYISSQRLRGPARKMVYMMEKKELRLEGNIRLQINPKIDTSSPFEVCGERLDYNEKKKRGKVEGEVQFFQEESQASADFLEFELFPDGENIKTMILKGRVKALLVKEEEENVASQEQLSFFDKSVKREIEAEELIIRDFPNLSKVRLIESKGSCSFKFISSTGSFTQILAETTKFKFDNNGELEEFYALENARMLDQGENPGEQRLIEGNTLKMKGQSDILWVKGKGDIEARVAYQESDIFAKEIAIVINNKNLEVKGGVRVVLKSKEEEKPIGIFSKDYPVFIKAREMRYFDEEKRFNFNGNIKAWQEKKELSAQEIALFKETGGLLCTGRVRTILPHKPKEEKEEDRLEISSERMTFIPEENLVSYEGKSTLKVRDINLQANSLYVYLKEEGGDIHRMIARGKVVIVQELGEGRGEEAIYNPADESIVLLGNPILVDKNKGVTRGHKLTFYLADGKILVENKDRERSVTVIKREK
ncbi:MAG: LPS export ABC transporter periplasmic protein LptC [Candidatus Aminicenantes bacterium]|nr:LPS export ABC transporter periplasmic protein LptC [Candidatus Aminicenantes bacterium]MBL7082813.1 LPS export ABC transporter periplasmic protein LptC [Candidatus Aminicenantes bacterium]